MQLAVSQREPALWARICRQNAAGQDREGHRGPHFVPACAIDMHVDISQDKSHFIRKFAGKMPQTKTATQTLCEPAWSKSTWTFHKAHFMREFTGKLLQTSWSGQAPAFAATAMSDRNVHLDHLGDSPRS